MDLELGLGLAPHTDLNNLSAAAAAAAQIKRRTRTGGGSRVERVSRWKAGDRAREKEGWGGDAYPSTQFRMEIGDQREELGI